MTHKQQQANLKSKANAHAFIQKAKAENIAKIRNQRAAALAQNKQTIFPKKAGPTTKQISAALKDQGDTGGHGGNPHHDSKGRFT